MRRFIMWIGLTALLIFLVACGTQNQPTPTAPPTEAQDTQVDAATDSEAENGVAAGNPKFVEFYADW